MDSILALNFLGHQFTFQKLNFMHLLVYPYLIT